MNCEENWRGFYLNGILDFSLIGILAKITKILADNEIGIFVVSTFNTDYILVKSQNLNRALTVLQAAGYAICKNDENEIAGLL
ncbi:ACT domain-containing protein [uncultured Thomasclavelia sp.]|uniref:ACT domain-containing protein n=1 Tax=uncultured Thomasclavelia sp. TaxID=3025759 RepID=UPI0025F8C396|nr:ACT domain-containing protein [uncultured Thomasclavelia sp.]